MECFYAIRGNGRTDLKVGLEGVRNYRSIILFPPGGAEWISHVLVCAIGRHILREPPVDTRRTNEYMAYVKDQLDVTSGRLWERHNWR